jgi:hypothetical protein
LFEKFVGEYSEHIPLYLNRIKYLDQEIEKCDGLLKKDYLEQIIKLSKMAINKINQNDLLCFFGAKKFENEDEEVKKYFNQLFKRKFSGHRKTSPINPYEVEALQDIRLFDSNILFWT